MSVYIGHASISETGGINGAKGDSTKKEVCVRTWYSKPWDFMAIHPDAAVREKHAAAVEDCCENDCIGYGQADRNTAYTEAKKVGFVVGKIKTKCNCDCSSLQNLCAVISGAPNVTYESNGWVTFNMKAKLAAAGYKIITDSTYLNSEDYCVRGAIYVKESSHTVCGLTNGSNASKTLAKAGITSSSTASGSSSSASGGLNKTPKWTGVSTVDGLNVRTWAGTEHGNIKSYPKLNKGNEVDVCDTVKAADGDVWYYVRIAGKYYGFVHSDYIKKASAELKVGDVVNFTGNKHYTSSYAEGVAKACKAGQAEITAINAKGTHPYHLKKTSGSKSTVYGWVNKEDIEA